MASCKNKPVFNEKTYPNKQKAKKNIRHCISDIWLIDTLFMITQRVVSVSGKNLLKNLVAAYENTSFHTSTSCIFSEHLILQRDETPYYTSIILGSW